MTCLDYKVVLAVRMSFPVFALLNSAGSYYKVDLLTRSVSFIGLSRLLEGWHLFNPNRESKKTKKKRPENS